MNERSLLDAALAYAARGWAVLPLHTITNGRCSCWTGNACKSPGKHPRTEFGFKDATTIREAIEFWWTTWPDSNIGIACIEGLVVIDVDAKRCGHDTFDKILAEHYLSPGPIALTGGGGLHVYLQDPSGRIARNRHDPLGPGVEIKANGLVVAPRSLHASGTPYRWMGSYDLRRELPVFPESLISALAAPPVLEPSVKKVLAPSRSTPGRCGDTRRRTRVSPRSSSPSIHW